MTKKSLAKFLAACEWELAEDSWNTDAEVCLSILPYRQDEACKVCRSSTDLHYYMWVLKSYLRAVLSLTSVEFKGRKWYEVDDVNLMHTIGGVACAKDQRLIEKALQTPFEKMDCFAIQETIDDIKQVPVFTGTYAECESYYDARHLNKSQTSWTIVPEMVCKVDYL